jgi:poly(A) polymerase
MKPAGSLSRAPWKHRVVLEQFIRKLSNKGFILRVVGGAVREAILGRTDDQCDIDLAIDATPDEVVAFCIEMGVQVIPSGIAYGTVTVILDGDAYEITSLRKDMRTDGRKAVVEYTKNWTEDAERRDLTINALYADWDGQYYDPTGQGLADLEARFLRFIGDPVKRIQEDYLRIIRFFRFMALFSNPRYDDATYEICISHGKQLQYISLERKWNELQKIFKANYPLNAIEGLITSKLMNNVCRLNWSLNKLERAIPWVKNYFHEVFYGVLGCINHFQMDRGICIPITLQKRLEDVCSKTIHPEVNLKDLYKLGRSVYRDVYIRNVITNQNFSVEALQKCTEDLQTIETVEIPKLPVSGGDLQEVGFTPGPVMGQILKDTEEWWVEKNFKPDFKSCLKHIQHLHLAMLKDKI